MKTKGMTHLAGFFGPLISKFWTRVCKLESKSDVMSLAEVGDDLGSHSSGTGVELGLVVDLGCKTSPNGSKAVERTGYKLII